MSVIMDFSTFLQWERASRDTIDFKKMYVDMCSDVCGGLMLSEIVYWYLPTQRGESKLRVIHDEFEWIAVRRYDWWERIRLSPREADAAITALVSAKLITKKVYKFDGAPTVHVRLNREQFLLAIESLIENPPTNPYAESVKSNSPNGEMEIPKRLKRNPQTVKSNSPNGEKEITDSGIPLTETTTENTTEITSETTHTDSAQISGGGDEPQRPNIFKLYEDNFGVLGGQLLTDALKDIAAEFPESWLEEGFKICVEANKRDLRYLRGILKRWKNEGRGAGKPNEAKSSGDAGQKMQESAQRWNLDDADNPILKAAREREEALTALPPNERAWAETYHRLELQLDSPTFEIWLKGARFLRVDGAVYVIGVAYQRTKEMLEKQMYRQIVRALREFAGQEADIRFEVAIEAKSE